MSYIDIAFLVLFAAMAIRGFFRGFVKEAISLIGIISAYFAAIYASSNVHGFKPVHNEEIGKIIVFLIVLVSVIIIFALIAFALTKIINFLKFGICNSIGGFFLLELKPSYCLD